MSAAKDIKIAKLLIKKKFITEVQAKKLLKLQKKYTLKEKEVSLFKLILKEKILSKDEILKAKASIKTKQTTQKSKVEIDKKKSTVKEQKNKESTSKKINKPPESKEAQDEPAEKTESYAATKTCPECNSNVEISAQECTTCAANLPTIVTVMCSVCRKSSPSNLSSCYFCDCDLKTGEAGKKTNVCKACKGVLLPGDALCTHCGKKSHKSNNSATKALGFISIATILIAINTGFGFAVWTYQGKAQSNINNKVLKKSDYYDLIETKNLMDYKFANHGEKQKEMLKEVISLMKKAEWDEVSNYLTDKVEHFDAHLLSVYAFNLYSDNKKNRIVSLHKAYPDQEYLKELSAEILFQKSRMAFREANYPKSYSLIKRVIQLKDTSDEYTFWAGLIAFSERDELNAAKYFEKCNQLSKSWPEAHLFLHYLLKKSNPAKSAQHLNEFKKNPNSLKHYQTLIH